MSSFMLIFAVATAAWLFWKPAALAKRKRGAFGWQPRMATLVTIQRGSNGEATGYYGLYEEDGRRFGAYVVTLEGFDGAAGLRWFNKSAEDTREEVEIWTDPDEPHRHCLVPPRKHKIGTARKMRVLVACLLLSSLFL